MARHENVEPYISHVVFAQQIMDDAASSLCGNILGTARTSTCSSSELILDRVRLTSFQSFPSRHNFHTSMSSTARATHTLWTLLMVYPRPTIPYGL